MKSIVRKSPPSDHPLTFQVFESSLTLDLHHYRRHLAQQIRSERMARRPRHRRIPPQPGSQPTHHTQTCPPRHRVRAGASDPLPAAADAPAPRRDPHSPGAGHSRRSRAAPHHSPGSAASPG